MRDGGVSDAALAAESVESDDDASPDPPMPEEAAWDVRVFREFVWDANVKGRRTFILHQGPDRARLVIRTEDGPIGGWPWPYTGFPGPFAYDVPPYITDVQYRWLPAKTITLVGERMPGRSKESFRFVAQGDQATDYAGRALALSCKTERVTVHPGGAVAAAKYFGWRDGRVHKYPFGNTKSFWVPDSTSRVSALVCTQTWSHAGSTSDAPPTPAAHPSLPSTASLVFTERTPGRVGVERVGGTEESALRWLVDPRAREGSVAPGAPPGDTADEVPWTVSTFRELLLGEHPRRLTWVFHRVPQPRLTVREQSPVADGQSPIAGATVEADYVWSQGAATELVGEEIGAGSFRFEAPSPGSSGLLLSCQTKNVLVRPSGAWPILTYVPARRAAPGVAPSYDESWRWEPATLRWTHALVCERQWRPAVATTDSGAQALARRLRLGVAGAAEPPLTFVAAPGGDARALEGVEWIAEGGATGSLRWLRTRM